jgi:GABA(A) receptor-associated protein
MADQVRYRDLYSFEQRKSEADRVIAANPSRIPVVCERVPGSVLPELDKRKFLAPVDLMVYHFVQIIHKKMKLSHNETIYIFAENKHLVRGD